MESKQKGTLNKKEENKKIAILLSAIAVVIVVVAIVVTTLNNNGEDKKAKADISSIVSKAETKIIFVGSSDSKKCSKCSKIKEYLDSQKINYLTYDVEDYKESEYKEMLRSIEINPDDFGYPAVIYIRDGRLYSNVINLDDTKPVEDFIKTYELKNVK